MIIKASGNIAAGVKFQYLNTLLCGEALCKCETICTQIGNTARAHLNQIMLDLAKYFLTINVLSKQKCSMCHGMRNPNKLKVRCYDSCMTDINKYFSIFFVGPRQVIKSEIHN